MLPFFAIGQSATEPLDLTTALNNKSGGWAIGNACGKDFRLNGIYKSDLDMRDEPLEILNSHFIIEGNVLNPGTIVYLCDNSVLEIRGGTLHIPDVEIHALKVYPNPAVNDINIKGIEVHELAIFDMYGRKLKHYTTFGTLHKIMINDLKSGVYVLVINGKITRKIVKR